MFYLIFIKDIIPGLCMIGINNSVVRLMIVTFVYTSITCDQANFFFWQGKKYVFSRLRLDCQSKLQWTLGFDHWNLVEGIGHGCVIDCNVSHTH